LVAPDRRSPLSVGLDWATRVMSVALGFVLPALLGAWIDGRLGSSPWGVLIGAALGFTAGMLQLVRIAQGGTTRRAARPPDRGRDPAA
jgi:F0F1-type ATP synthase assembly protein I